MNTSTRFRFCVLGLFFLSGVAGLVYQVAWTRQLVLVFGNTLLATSTVLSAFMAGLAAGSYALGVWVDRRPRALLRLYAALEAGIGLFGLAFPLLLAAATPLYVNAFERFGETLALVNLLRFAVGFGLIAVPTFLMGGTLPVLLKYLSEELDRIGLEVGSLYGLNTAGAVVGCVAAGYYLLGAIGLRATTLVAVAINLGVAVVAWLLPERRAIEPVAAMPTPAPAARAATDGAHPPRPVVVVVHLAIAVSGFCALAYEVLWARMLNLFLNHDIYSFTATIGTFLLGIALGSLLYARWLARLDRRLELLAATQIGIALLAFATPHLFVALHGALFAQREAAYTVLKTVAIMLGPTLLMGVAVPLAVQICQQGRGREGHSVGSVYAVNTVGSILGAFVAGFVLVPRIGLHAALLSVALLNFGAGLAVLAARRSGAVRLGLAAGWTAAAALAFALAPEALFRELYRRSTPDSRILHYLEGKVANVVVYDFDAGYKDLHLNGVEEASSRLWHVQLFKLLGVLPMVVHDDPDEALMIAFGAGMSAGAAARLTSSLEVVDLNPDIAGPAEIFRRENLDVLDHPRLKLTVNDGRNELLLDPKRYSVIISDATNPKMFDSWTLYTREFYELTRRRLLSGGVFAQWLVYPLPGDSLRAVLATFRSVYPHASLWCIHGSSQCLMLGTPGRLELDYADLSARLEPALRETRFVDYGVATVPKFLSFLLLGEDELGRYLEGYGRISTDDLPYPQFQVGRALEGVRECLDLLVHQRTVAPYLTNLGAERERVLAELEAHREVSQRLNLGFYLGRPEEFEKAALVAAAAGLADDANVASALRFDGERLRHHLGRLAVEPDDPTTHNQLGYVYWRRDELDRARRHLERALAIAPEFADARAHLARVLLDAGELDAAERELLDLRRRLPTSRVLHLVDRGLELVRLERRARWEAPSFELDRARAAAHLALGDLTHAVAAARRAEARAGADPRRHLELAALYESLDLADETAGALGRAAALAPGDARLASAASTAARLAHDPAERQRRRHARLVAGLAPADDHDEHPASCRRAMTAWSARDPLGRDARERLTVAAGEFERAIHARPDHRHAYLDAALLHELLGDLSAAAAVLRSAAERLPEDSGLRAERRRVELLSVVEADGASADSFGELGELWAARGDLERAVSAYRQALERTPGDLTASSRLAALQAAVGAYPEAESVLEGALEHAATPEAAADLRSRLDAIRRRLAPASEPRAEGAQGRSGAAGRGQRSRLPGGERPT